MGPIARRNHDTYNRVDTPLTLDGHAYMKMGRNQNLYRAIDWLNKNVEGQPVILEATGADYLYEYGKVSANTGLPTVLGWWSHVDQREYGRSTANMKRDIKTIYESLDIPEVLELLRKYSVRYIYIGKIEKREYSDAGIAKFQELTDYMTPVYANPDVTIYRVNDYGLNVDFAKVASDSNALADLQRRLTEKKEEERRQKELEEERKREAVRNMPPKSIFTGGIGEGRGQFMEPRSLAVQSNGDIYVADFRNHRIQKFDPEGRWLLMWGETGNGPGQFKDICDVAVDDQGVYVVDTFNNRVQKFTHDGKHVAVWQHPSDSLFYPRGIATDRKGFIYIADTGNSRIVKMTNTGEFVKKWGSVGDDKGELDNPIGLDVHDDRLYVCDTKNQRVSVFDLEGRYINDWPVKGWEGEVFVEPYLTVDKTNRVWVSDPTAHKIRVYTVNGELLETIAKTINGMSMNLPMGLAVSGNNQILAVLSHLHRVGRIDPAVVEK